MEQNLAYETKKYSYADLELIDDDNRYEIIDGNLYLMSAPSVTHQAIVGEIYVQLYNFLKGKKCRTFISPLDIVLSNSKVKNKMFNVVQPDVIVICDQSKVEEKKIFGAPDLVVEVVSPSNSTRDKLYKFNLYQKYKVREYWLIEPGSETIMPYSLNEKGFYELAKMYDLKEEVPVKILPGCKICLKELLEEEKDTLREVGIDYRAE